MHMYDCMYFHSHVIVLMHFVCTGALFGAGGAVIVLGTVMGSYFPLWVTLKTKAAALWRGRMQLGFQLQVQQITVWYYVYFLFFLIGFPDCPRTRWLQNAVFWNQWSALVSLHVTPASLRCSARLAASPNDPDALVEWRLNAEMPWTSLVWARKMGPREDAIKP